MGKIFGTNGVRGIINEGFTVEMVLDIARAVGTVLGPGKIAIARDSRMGGEMFANRFLWFAEFNPFPGDTGGIEPGPVALPGAGVGEGARLQHQA